ncbi:MAG: hypothetical protein EA380_01230 [Phycisphaeraceae bacterium]|nr:MAG: hypothetical protein EA380_01230 [Phycisphaeraceae bacterium]
MRHTLMLAGAIAALHTAPAAFASPTSPNGLGFLSGSADAIASGSALIVNIDTQDVLNPSAFEQDVAMLTSATFFSVASETDGGLAELFPALGQPGSFSFANGSIAARSAGLTLSVTLAAFGNAFTDEMTSNDDGDFLVSGSFNADAEVNLIIQIPELVEIFGGSFGAYDSVLGALLSDIFTFLPAGENPGQIIEDAVLFPATGLGLAPGTYALTGLVTTRESLDLRNTEEIWSLDLPLVSVLPSPGAASLLIIAGAAVTRRRR